MEPPVVALVSPGEMGSALGASLRRGGAQVLTSAEGRSVRTRELAATAGLELLDLDGILAAADVVLSVVPPDRAADVVEDVADRCSRLGVRPLLVDLNAVAPGEVVALAEVATAAGLELCDGSVSGSPPRPDGPVTRVLLSGPGAERVAALPWTDVSTRVLPGPVGAASAAKMCTASVRKGTSALVVNALLTAEAHGVLEPVEAELRRALGRDPLVDAALAAAKAWRFVPEMRAVAATQAAAGLDAALFDAVADVFDRTSRSPAAGVRPEEVDRSAPDADVAAVVASLRPGDVP